MDPSRGRRASLPAARLIFIAGLIALLVVLRLGSHGGASAEASSAAAAAAEPAAARAPARAAPGAVPISAAERAERERAVEGVIAKWIKEADKKSRGKAGWSNVQISLHAVELGEQREGLLASRKPDVSLLPASNMKLVTTAVALALAGPSFEFATRVEAGGALADGLLRGDLVVRAAGDPLTDREGTGEVEDRLDALARELAQRGLRRIEGDLVLDLGVFADPAPAPGWPDASQHWADYCALSGGLTVNGGVLRASVLPGGAPRVAVHPAPHGLAESYSLRFGAKNDVRVGATATTCTVKGELPAAQAATWSASFAHPDPVGLFGSVFAASLARAGIELEGAVARRRGAPPGELLATLRTPLTDVLVPINTYSTNGVADQLFLALGALALGDGSRAGGAEASARALESLHVPRAGFAQVDGSGLSRENRATARQIVALLEAVYRTPPDVREAFFSSLAVAGRTGTLEDRLGGTPAEGLVSAKTGWIEGASALSGVAHAPGGRDVLFSILVAYPREQGGLNKQVWKPMQDELVLALFQDPP